MKGHPRQIFLLTDGEVSDTNQIISLVAENSKLNRVHGIGIGQGASKALIKGCAEKGRGRSVFIADNENVAGKVIELLQTALSPAITEFELAYDDAAVEGIIPNPKEMPCIMKNEAVNLFVFLKPGFEGGARFSLSYRDSATKLKHTSDMILEGKPKSSYAFLEKMAQHRKLSILCDAIRNKTRVASDALLGEVGDLKSYVVATSVQQQVLCELTAYICVGKTL